MKIASRVSLPTLAAAILLGALGSAQALIVPFTEGFTSDASGWIAEGTNILTWQSQGGVGNGSYIQTTATVDTNGFGAIVFRGNNNKDASGDAFVGNWMAGGVTNFSAYIKHDAPEALNFYIRLDAGMGKAASSWAFSIQPGSWVSLNLPIQDSLGSGGIWQSYGAASSFSQIFTNIQNVQIVLDVGQSPVVSGGTYQVGVTQVAIVPEPQTVILLILAGGGLMALGLRRRRQAAKTQSLQKLGAVVVAALLFMTAGAWAQFYNFTFPGASSFDGWENLNYEEFPGFGSWPGSSDWPGPAAANQVGSGDAKLWRTGKSALGYGPYFATESLYFFSNMYVSNALGGSLRITDATPVPGLTTIVFQIEIGEIWGHDFKSPEGLPVLRLSAGGDALAPSAKVLIGRRQNGEIPYPSQENPDEDVVEPVFINKWAFQWNIPTGTPVSSLTIDFSAVEHSQIWGMQLDQTATAAPGLLTSEFAMKTHGSPVFDGVKTEATYKLRVASAALVQYAASTPEFVVEYSPNLSTSSWKNAGVFAADSEGNLSVTVSENGDHRSAWSRQMFFRTAPSLGSSNP